MNTTQPERILILGGGFAGLYAATHLDKTLARDADVEVTLVNRENFLLFTPMLHEVAASDLGAVRDLHLKRGSRRVPPSSSLCTHIELVTSARPMASQRAYLIPCVAPGSPCCLAHWLKRAPL